MTEGSTVRSKRLGARFFKNPPQPHMCIRDSLKGSSDPCYVNVLSWDKVAFGVSTEGVPLYGGMKVCPPRTEKKETSVFAVMVNPEILKEHGKSARNPKGQSWLIDILLNFIEEMNNGVVFNRCYTVLRDRDITGELKEIWMVVQSERAKAQQITGSDELRRPVPQYPQYQEQLQQQQQQQHPMSQQHHHPPPPQQQQQQQQQQQLQHPYEESPQQPPQYHTSIFYGQESNEKCENYDINYRRAGQNMTISHNDRMYQSSTIGQQYHGNTPRVVTDRYMFRDPAVSGSSQVPQQNCIGYPGYQYQQPQQQQQQQPRPIGAGPFPPNVHPNATINCPPPPQSTNSLNLRPEPYHHYGHPISVPGIPEITYSKYYVASRPPQTRGPQLQIPIPQFYEAQNPRPPNFLRMLRPQETETVRRTANTNSTNTNIPSHPTQPKPTDGLDVPIEWHFESLTPCKSKFYDRNMSFESSGSRTIRKPGNPSVNPSSTRDQNSKKPSTINFLKLFRPEEPQVNTKIIEHSSEMSAGNSETLSKNRQKSPDESSNSSETSVSCSGVQQPDGKAAIDSNAKNSGKSKMKVLKRNKSLDEKRCHIRDVRIYLNGKLQRPNDSKSENRTCGKDADVENRLSKVILEAERNGNADKERTKAQNGKKINADLRNAFKILERRDKDSDEVYTILRKPEATTAEEDISSDIAQISIKDCGETSELGAVLS